MKGIDLNSKKTSRISIFNEKLEVNHACRQACLRSNNGAYPDEGVPPLRGDLQRKSQGQIVQLSGSIPVHGVCSVNLSGKPQRDRNLPSSAKQEALSYGHTWWYCSQYAVQRQQGAQLENLRRLRPGINQNCQTIVRRRGFGARTRQYDLCARFIHHRPVSLRLSMGTVSIHQVSHQTSYSARSTGQYSNVYSHFRWKDARCEYSRHPDTRSRSILYHGPRLCGFRKVVQDQPGRCIFRHPLKKAIQYTGVDILTLSQQRKNCLESAAIKPSYSPASTQRTTTLSR